MATISEFKEIQASLKTTTDPNGANYPVTLLDRKELIQNKISSFTSQYAYQDSKKGTYQKKIVNNSNTYDNENTYAEGFTCFINE